MLLSPISQHELARYLEEPGSKDSTTANIECWGCQERETEECNIQTLRETLIDYDLKEALEDSYYPYDRKDAIELKSLLLAIIVLRFSRKPGLRVDEFLDRWTDIFVRSLDTYDQDEFLLALKGGDFMENEDEEVNTEMEERLATHYYFDMDDRVNDFRLRLMKEETGSLALLRELPYNIPDAQYSSELLW